jgi:RNA polymerase sigma-70 factor (ECF subfamily)
VFVALEFARLVRANQSMVFSLALRFLRNHEVAEEVSQDVFLQLYQNLGRIQNEAHATWWLRRTICHRAIDEVRKRKLRPQIGLDSIADPAASRHEPDWLQNERLRRLVEALPVRPRMVVVLRYQEDLDPTDIAGLLGIPVSTVKSHLHRSLAVLRARLARESAPSKGVCYEYGK